MALERLGILFDRERPNKFTRQMGEQIRQAREDAGYSQTDLAKLIRRRQAFLSDMENGKAEPDASTLYSLAYYLKKPITFFYPPPLYEKLVIEDMDALGTEMQIHFEQLISDELKRLAIRLVQNMSEFDLEKLFREIEPIIRNQIERKERRANRQKRK